MNDGTTTLDSGANNTAVSSAIPLEFDDDSPLNWSGNGNNGPRALVMEYTLTVSTVPEPSSYALLAGLLGLSCVMVRRRRA
ncbi:MULTISPECIES: PEP-CTERM sorting domain-containing protein [unclassified Lentimonas]|uniref:PEP-CTERM sorting domain-containing protein n=1 Tax=unclassified Lentimonas TaxID=2630993 RepID=UPI001FD11194|nr:MULTISPECIES: PEP-CTERM sorting domain-containing protein [unclassified Lentimonas]